jgi:hypothetical protein
MKGNSWNIHGILCYLQEWRQMRDAEALDLNAEEAHEKMIDDAIKQLQKRFGSGDLLRQLLEIMDPNEVASIADGTHKGLSEPS